MLLVTAVCIKTCHCQWIVNWVSWTVNAASCLLNGKNSFTLVSADEKLFAIFSINVYVLKLTT